jgi:sigma-B regulation protein RsbU (phosphoserine phosphatase)
MSDTPSSGLPASESRETSERLALLYALSQTFNSSIDLDEVLNRVMDEVIVITRAERGFMMLYDENGHLTFSVARGMDQHIIHDPQFQISLSVVEKVARSGQAVIASDAQLDPRFNMSQSVRLLGLRSILCVPLRLKERSLGAIFVDHRVQAGIFAQADLDLLNAVANSAATAIENARLYKIAVEKTRLEHELQMARQVQASLLPTETPQLPGWEFVAHWMPARQVAGDYFDFILEPNGQLGMVVADVSDKGMPAALFMALTRSIVRASLDATLSPRERIQRANRLICADAQSGMFVTLFYACLDATRNQLTYVNGGHNPPLFFRMGKRAGQGALSRLARTGMALGVDAEASYEERTLDLNPGDFLVLYTDGVTDALNANGQSFDMDRLERVALENRDRSAADISAALENAIQVFIGDAPLFDDITLLIARRTI